MDQKKTIDDKAVKDAQSGLKKTETKEKSVLPSAAYVSPNQMLLGCCLFRRCFGIRCLSKCFIRCLSKCFIRCLSKCFSGVVRIEGESGSESVRTIVCDVTSLPYSFQ